MPRVPANPQPPDAVRARRWHNVCSAVVVVTFAARLGHEFFIASPAGVRNTPIAAAALDAIPPPSDAQVTDTSLSHKSAHATKSVTYRSHAGRAFILGHYDNALRTAGWHHARNGSEREFCKDDLSASVRWSAGAVGGANSVSFSISAGETSCEDHGKSGWIRQAPQDTVWMLLIGACTAGMSWIYLRAGWTLDGEALQAWYEAVTPSSKGRVKVSRWGARLGPVFGLLFAGLMGLSVVYSLWRYVVD